MELDLGKVCFTSEVWINDKPAGSRFWGPHRYDVSKLLTSGKSTIRVRIANLINNNYGDVRESGLFGPVTLRSPK